MRNKIVSMLGVSILLALCPALALSQTYSNQGTVNQSGDNGKAFIEQSGANNNALINQSGDNDAAITVQEGQSNVAVQTQIGKDNNKKKDTNNPYLIHPRSDYFVQSNNVGVIIHQVGNQNSSVQNQWADDSLINNYVLNGNQNAVVQNQYASSRMMEMFTNISDGHSNAIYQEQTGVNNLMQNYLLNASDNSVTQIQNNPAVQGPNPTTANRNSVFLYVNDTHHSTVYQSQSNGFTSRAIVWQVGVEGANVQQIQNGKNNHSVAYQSALGSKNRDNAIEQSQDGESNLLFTLQYGEDNYSSARQLTGSTGNTMFQYQSGLDNSSWVTQADSGNSTTVLQFSGESDLTVSTPTMNIFGGNTSAFSFPVVSLPTN